MVDPITNRSPIEITLLPEHLAMLREGSGIGDAEILARGYRSIRLGQEKELEAYGYTRSQCRVPGLLLPVHTTDGANSVSTYRPDIPRAVENRRKRNPDGTFKTHVIKYEIPKGSAVRLDCPPCSRSQLRDPASDLWVTEGPKKADALASRGLCAIDFLGVWNFKGKNEFGGVTLLADFDHIALNGRNVRVVFDSDVMCKREVQEALSRITEHLQRKGAHVGHVYLPAENGHKVGVDDYLLTHSVADLEALVNAPRPIPQAAAPIVELLDVAPSELRRPLSLVDGRAYAAIWPFVKVTVTETIDKEGKIVKYDEPVVTTRQRLFIVRSDGRVFGEGAPNSLDDLGISVRLSEIPPQDRLWSTPGVKTYGQGVRPNRVDVFKRIADVVDRFIDFDRSLGSQREMAELVACYVLATWFLDAFQVIGFLWPNGDRGSGKTQLLTIVAELAYLGQLILAGGSYASLRDLADYGATLCFDDAENIADPKKTDPDKRALLLAGNRRGNTVPVKEPGPDRTWRTRQVGTYCARCFSATRLPDAILASRTIIVPLIRTPDRYRANADPLEHSLWPHDRRALIDDLWALSLANLSDLPRYEALVNEKAKLTGRNLEPWRAVLAVSAWLEDGGATGLWARIEQLAVGYQDERQDMESTDLSVLVIRAICRCLVSDCDVLSFRDVCDVFLETEKQFLKTSQITNEARRIAEEQELGIEPDHINNRRIGWILKKLRLEKGREAGTGKRGWQVSEVEMQKYVVSFGLYTPGKTSQTSLMSQTSQAPARVEREI